jgi:SAM-dependent methyltransferase
MPPVPTPRENWYRIFREEPEVFHAFSRAEDPATGLGPRLLELARFEDQRVLEIGCGTGRFTSWIARRARQIIPIDQSWGLLGQFDRRSPVRPVLGRGQELPITSGAVDSIFMGFVLAHMTPGARSKVLRECDRVLRPCSSGIWVTEDHWSGAFHQLRGREECVAACPVERLIDQHGFRMIEILDTQIVFDSVEDAARVLGRLCREEVADQVRERGLANIPNRVIILQRR